MSEPQGNFQMRFICGPNKKLLKGAPGNYECGKTYRKPYRHSKFAFWELIEDVPIVKVPDLSEEESVFEEAIFLPEEETPSYDVAVIEQTVSATPIDFDARTKELAEDYRRQGMALLDAEKGVLVDPGKTEDTVIEEEDEVDRDALKQTLDEAGVEYSNRAHTPTLQALVDELESEKES